MHIIHLTDLHFGCEDEAALQAAAKSVAARAPDLVIVTGDISKDGKASEIEAACAWLRTLAAPVLVTPGNHDMPYYEPLGRMFFPWARFERATHGLRTQAWSTPDWCIAPINTARALQLRLNWAQGAIDDAQVAAAAALFGAAPGDALKIVACHHPLDWPNDAPIKGQTINGARALNALIDAGAQVFLSGHLHFASARLIGRRAVSITSGTLSKRVRHEPCAFTAIKRSGARLEVEVIHVVQGVAQTASLRAFTLGAETVEAASEQKLRV